MSENSFETSSSRENTPENTDQQNILDDLDKFEEFIKNNKRTKLHKNDIVKWFQSRQKKNEENTKKNYLLYPQQLVEEFRIKKIFTVFDEDNSDAIDIQEMLNMFKEYEIPIEFEQLERVYKVLNTNTLNFKDFKQCAISEETNTVFRKIMKEVEEKQKEEEKRQKKLKYLHHLQQNKKCRNSMFPFDISSSPKANGRVEHFKNNSVLSQFQKRFSSANDIPDIKSFKSMNSSKTQRTKLGERKGGLYQNQKKEKVFMPNSFQSMVRYISYRINRQKRTQNLDQLKFSQNKNLEKVQLFQELISQDNLNDETVVEKYKQKMKENKKREKVSEINQQIIEQINEKKKLKEMFFSDQKNNQSTPKQQTLKSSLKKQKTPENSNILIQNNEQQSEINQQQQESFFINQNKNYKNDSAIKIQEGQDEKENNLELLNNQYKNQLIKSKLLAQTIEESSSGFDLEEVLNFKDKNTGNKSISSFNNKKPSFSKKKLELSRLIQNAQYTGKQQAQNMSNQLSQTYQEWGSSSYSRLGEKRNPSLPKSKQIQVFESYQSSNLDKQFSDQVYYKSPYTKMQNSITHFDSKNQISSKQSISKEKNKTSSNLYNSQPSNPSLQLLESPYRNNNKNVSQKTTNYNITHSNFNSTAKTGSTVGFYKNSKQSHNIKSQETLNNFFKNSSSKNFYQNVKDSNLQTKFQVNFRNRNRYKEKRNQQQNQTGSQKPVDNSIQENTLQVNNFDINSSLDNIFKKNNYKSSEKKSSKLQTKVSQTTADQLGHIYYKGGEKNQFFPQNNSQNQQFEDHFEKKMRKVYQDNLNKNQNLIMENKQNLEELKQMQEMRTNKSPQIQHEKNNYEKFQDLQLKQQAKMKLKQIQRNVFSPYKRRSVKKLID